MSRPKAARTMKTIKKDFDRKTFYIGPDPRQGQNNREEPHHAESFPEKKKIYVVIVFLSGFCWYKIINNW